MQDDELSAETLIKTTQPGQEFKTHNPDGTPKTCKFCHKHVWWHRLLGRWYDPGGKTLHVENCELRRQHFHNRAMDAAEVRRQK